jgi:hypothetical protein
VVALAPEQIALLLGAADHSPSPWLGPWTVLAAATGARNGELCGLEWSDLELDIGTVQFRQALTIVDPAILPDAATVGGSRKELAVGPVKICCQQRDPHPATVRGSGAAPSPPRAAPAATGREAARHRGAAVAGARPAAPPGPAGASVPHRAGHAGQPEPRQPRLHPPGRQRRAGRPSPSAAPCPGVGDGGRKGTASIIAAQLRHADGGALTQRVYIHQLPRTTPRLAGLIEGMFGPAAREAQAVPTVSVGVRWRETGGKPERQTRPDQMARSRVSAAQKLCGRDRIRTCVGNAGDFTGRTAVTSRVPSYPRLAPIIACDCTNGRSTASTVPRRPHPRRRVPSGPASGGGK